jgi:protein involved in polysaccharide export with SLBB domain
VLQVLNQRGFGRPTQDANRQYYVGIGDAIVIQDRIHPEYNGVQEIVRMDGVVTLPEVGEVYITGLSPRRGDPGPVAQVTRSTSTTPRA